jgi:hypothetical protein
MTGGEDDLTEVFTPGRGSGGEAAPPPARDDSDDAPAEDCPLVPLGARQGEYYLLSPAGELRSVPFSRMNAAGLESLTDGDTRWYFRHFSEVDPKTREMSIAVPRARRWIMRACQQKGLFDPSTPVRGRGVWNSDNAPLVHAGDGIWTHAAGWRPAGYVADGSIYIAAAKIVRPAPEPASETEARGLLETLGARWNFVEPWGASVVAGFMAQGFLGQAPDWRAHVYCVAAAGSGKSWLTDALKAALGGAANPAMNNYTESYLRQSLNNEARAILLDEAEPGDQNGNRIKAVIELMRHMSGLAGATAGRGSADGKAISYHMAGSVWMASILQGRLTPQDRSRITTIRLGRLPDNVVKAGGREDTLAFIAALREASPRLWARAIHGWPRFLENLDVWRRELAEADCSARLIDQVATLFAARDMMMSDTPTDAQALRDDIDLIKPLIDDVKEETGADVEGVECWQHLMTTLSTVTRSGTARTVASLVMQARTESGDGAARQLQGMGLRYYHLERDGVDYGMGVAVSNTHAGVRTLFRDTRWGDDAWPGALDTLVGSVRVGKSMRIGGLTCKAVWVPAAYLPVSDAPIDGDPAADPDDPGADPPET